MGNEQTPVVPFDTSVSLRSPDAYEVFGFVPFEAGSGGRIGPAPVENQPIWPVGALVGVLPAWLFILSYVGQPMRPAEGGAHPGLTYASRPDQGTGTESTLPSRGQRDEAAVTRSGPKDVKPFPQRPRATKASRPTPARGNDGLNRGLLDARPSEGDGRLADLADTGLSLDRGSQAGDGDARSEEAGSEFVPHEMPGATEIARESAEMQREGNVVRSGAGRGTGATQGSAARESTSKADILLAYQLCPDLGRICTAEGLCVNDGRMEGSGPDNDEEAWRQLADAVRAACR